MPGIHQTRTLPYTPEQMFDLVADVKHYPDFLPWVIATRIQSDSETEMVADMVVGFKAIREKFTSRVIKTRPESINVHYVDGPLSDLKNDWTFKPVADGCEIEFCVDFTFKSRIFETLAGAYFDRAFRRMMTAFEERADELYGSSSSSAHSVA
ncbi:MAG: type II toxin-antitoxin system RatA family toxin [Erythrobacter sp.]|nr:type II toxin-antitoxin system RatA family toxin [Erythrobacter sp.]NCQ64757.1 type II toxin-antitoxin system RatA family toxin [Alphaproteobacteria bacterium]